MLSNTWRLRGQIDGWADCCFRLTPIAADGGDEECEGCRRGRHCKAVQRQGSSVPKRVLCELVVMGGRGSNVTIVGARRGEVVVDGCNVGIASATAVATQAPFGVGAMLPMDTPPAVGSHVERCNDFDIGAGGTAAPCKSALPGVLAARNALEGDGASWRGGTTRAAEFAGASAPPRPTTAAKRERDGPAGSGYLVPKASPGLGPSVSNVPRAPGRLLAAGEFVAVGPRAAQLAPPTPELAPRSAGSWRWPPRDE